MKIELDMKEFQGASISFEILGCIKSSFQPALVKALLFETTKNLSHAKTQRRKGNN